MEPADASLRAWEQALARQEAAVARLGELVRGVRRSLEGLAFDAVGSAQAEAPGLLQEIARVAAMEGALRRRWAVALGLPADAGLGEVVRALGERGAALGARAAALAARVEECSRDTAALGIGARYGAAVTGNLAALVASNGTAYGPTGRYAAGPRAPGRTA
ncbi:MAG: hypothetical protein Kow0092_14410 [Deferrisomatales bacterium]